VAQETKKSGYDYLKEAVEQMKEQGASDAQVIETLVKEIPADRLKSLYRDAVSKNRDNLASAIEGAFFNPTVLGRDNKGAAHLLPGGES